MNLNNVLNQLEEIKLVHDKETISVVMMKGKSLNFSDKIFECRLVAAQAKRFFGKFDVMLSKIITEGEYHTPVLKFILSDEENDKEEQK